jgi:hypothetical protein
MAKRARTTSILLCILLSACTSTKPTGTHRSSSTLPRAQVHPLLIHRRMLRRGASLHNPPHPV